MDKPLSDMKKDDNSKQDEVATSAPASPYSAPESNFAKPGNHDFIAEGGSKSIMGSEIVAGDKTKGITVDVNTPQYDPELTAKSWEKSKKDLRWDATPFGRAMIRLESRGALGAAAFAAGGWYVTKGEGMKGYNPEIGYLDINPTKPLQYIAKTIDTFVGKPIQVTAKLLGASEEKAAGYVHFRPTRYATNYSFGNVRGRSLGTEAVMISTDFSAASFADASGRDLADLADHHVKHTWIDDKGNIDYNKAATALGKTLWRYVTYNSGEDWAVSIPYAFYMKGQRKLINKYNPGFELDFDRGLNGGSFKVDKNGNPTGNYLGAGMLDLQGRFTAYNVGTLMYRETYNYIDDRIHGKKVFIYGSAGDEENKKHGVVHDIGHLLKWGARSTVKGVIYMTPAVPFFSVFRSSQTKSKGIFINPDNGAALGYSKNNGGSKEYDILHADELIYGSLADKMRGGDVNHDNLPPVKFYHMQDNGKMGKFSGVINNHPLSDRNFDPYKLGEGSKVLNKIGQMQGSGRNAVNSFARGMGWQKFANGEGWTGLAPRTVDSYVNAAFSYTPYMYAKGETARLWDDGKMDASAERMINGAASLNFKEFKAGAGEVWRSVLHKPLRDPVREAYAQRRIDEDSSPPDNLTEEQARLEVIKDLNDEPPVSSWRDRVIHNAPVPQEKTKPEKKSASHADQEAMRKALQELQPPTNSIH